MARLQEEEMKERERRGMLVFFKKLGKKWPKNSNFIRKGPNCKKIDKFKPSVANNSETCPANTLKGTIWQKTQKKNANRQRAQVSIPPENI